MHRKLLRAKTDHGPVCACCPLAYTKGDVADLESEAFSFFHGQSSCMNPLNPKKLLLTKWTAIKPVAKQKHFLVSRVIQPEIATDPIEQVELEAVFSKATQIMAWRDLQDDTVWLQGWV